MKRILLTLRKVRISSSVNDDSLDWAKQAYLQLKQKQKAKRGKRVTSKRN